MESQETQQWDRHREELGKIGCATDMQVRIGNKLEIEHLRRLLERPEVSAPGYILPPSRATFRKRGGR